MSATDAQRRPVFVDRRNNRLFADPLIGNGAWPEVLVTPGMFGEFPADTILGRRGTSGNASALSADVTIELLNTATSSVIQAARVAAASTTGAGVVQLNDATNSTSTTTAATANAVKSVYDLANAALPKSGGTMTGSITFAAGQPTATTSTAGIVQLTNSISSTNTTTAATPASVKTAYDAAFAAMPRTGGTFTGAVTFNDEATLRQLNGDCLAGLRNRIINGGMRVCQRSTSTAVNALDAAGAYTLDRWRAVNDTDGTFTVSQSTDVPAGQGFTNSLLVTTNTADASLGATQRASIEQRIEGERVADLAYGTASAKPTILSFWVKATSAATYGLSIRNAGSGATRSYNASYSVAVANTWEKKTIAIPGDASGTWATDNGVGINITFSLGAGSSAQGNSGWQAGDTDGVSGSSVLPISFAGFTWSITGVQLETGTASATPFERRPMALEMLLCQRYFWKSNNPGTTPGAATTVGQIIGIATSGGSMRITVPFQVTLRDTPSTVVVYSPATGISGRVRDDTGAVDRISTLVSSGASSASISATTSASALVRFHIFAEAEL